MSDAENYSIAFVTISDKQAADKLSDEMLNKKLVACVNIVSGVESRYVWEGKVNIDSEVLMIIKTRTSRLKELGELIKDKHPYDCPEFITTKIDDGNSADLKWLGKTFQKSK
ncbi:homolog [Paramuricea clavata]|nr:homolog [Paramuricea clavata]